MCTYTVLIVAMLIIAAQANTCPSTLGDNCGQPPTRLLTDAQQDEIVAAHNNLRNKVALGDEDRGNPGPQPPAANMLRMSWDDEMSELAQSWADQCTYAHNLCGGSERFGVNQNVFAMMAGDSNYPINFTESVQSWYSEVDVFDRSLVPSYTYADQYGHYSQVVWGDTIYVGCGYIVYLNGDTGDYWYLLVCNYGPGGNIGGAEMYDTSGDACTACPDSTTCDSTYPGLCS